MVVEYEVNYVLDGVTISIEKVGGGTIGKKYAGTWNYDYSGPDASETGTACTGTPKTHAEVAFMVHEYYLPKL